MRLYLDTNVISYAVRRTNLPPFTQDSRALMDLVRAGGHEAVVSSVTVDEIQMYKDAPGSAEMLRELIDCGVGFLADQGSRQVQRLAHLYMARGLVRRKSGRTPCTWHGRRCPVPTYW